MRKQASLRDCAKATESIISTPFACEKMAPRLIYHCQFLRSETRQAKSSVLRKLRVMSLHVNGSSVNCMRANSVFVHSRMRWILKSSFGLKSYGGETLKSFSSLISFETFQED